MDLSHRSEWWGKARLTRRSEWWGGESSSLFERKRLIFNWNVVELHFLRREARQLVFIIIVKVKMREGKIGDRGRERCYLEKSGSGPKSFFRSRHRSTNYKIIVLMDDIELVGYYKDYWTRDISTFVD